MSYQSSLSKEVIINDNSIKSSISQFTNHQFNNKSEFFNSQELDNQTKTIMCLSESEKSKFIPNV